MFQRKGQHPIPDSVRARRGGGLDRGRAEAGWTALGDPLGKEYKTGKNSGDSKIWGSDNQGKRSVLHQYKESRQKVSFGGRESGLKRMRLSGWP